MKVVLGIFIFTQLCWSANQKDLQKEVALKQNKILNMEVRQEVLIRDLIRINKKIKSQANKFAQIQNEIESINAEINKQKTDIKVLSQQLVESKKRLITKIKAISKIKSGNLLQVALVHSNLTDIEKSVKMMGIVASYDVQYINDYYEKKMLLSSDLKKLDSRYQILNQKKVHLSEQRTFLEKDLKERRAWLEDVKKSRLFTETEISRIRKNGKRNLDDLGVFDVFSKETIVKNKGRLLAPVEGTLSHSYGFGSENDSIIIANSGVFVSTDSSQTVKALFNAEVAYTGNLEGLGQVVILDHGDNYYSVYGNLNGILVKNRQIVRTGQAIAQSDYSPLFGSHGLYFEMRHYAQSLNPRDWIRSFHESN